MRMSRLFVSTLRENPANAEVVSHQLLVRAGYIRQLTSGIYSYMPLMWRVLQKVAQIVREEMNRAGAQELMMPIWQPAELWQESGRWDVYGKELVRLQDRHERDMVLAPTHEEVITSLARSEIKSYRQLPVNLYQIQNKYRDERRPRFGLLRGREFIMKDAYSFHASQSCLEQEYRVMADAYRRIFERCGLDTKMVRSDSGAIGGSVSHEFMVLTGAEDGDQQSGENDVFHCDHCDYAANGNRAEARLMDGLTDGQEQFPTEQDVETPGADSIESLSKHLHCSPSLICKALLYIGDEKSPFLLLLRGDVEAEETKVLNVSGAHEVRMATAEEVAQYTGSVKGFVGVGQCGLSITAESATTHAASLAVNGHTLPVYCDSSVANLKHFVIAYNKPGWHRVGFNWDEPTQVFLQQHALDLRLARVGDGCPNCEPGRLQKTRGIEVGNIFQLGTKYSEKMGARFSAEDGTEQPFIMGCYGIGVSRVAASAIERFHDKAGIVWPPSIAPYQAVVVVVNTEDDTQMRLAVQMYEVLKEKGIETVLDDRNERAGVKFKDADLIGYPIRITVGKKAGDGLVEIKRRYEDKATDVPDNQVVSVVRSLLQTWHAPAFSGTVPVTVGVG
ncbi:MAG: proline--tRNA ligase [Candidatus Melainabacteria bacterium]|nr:proline--tRNA ligase [Candidatus Melainabacteria bacterium]